jgi:hypothetical protein
VALFAVTVGHWLIYLCANTVLYQLGETGLLGMLADFHTYGLTPPLTFAALTISFRDIGDFSRQAEMRGQVAAALAGVVFYAALAGLLWWRLCARFRRLTGRGR